MAVIKPTEVEERAAAAASKKNIAEFIGDQKMLDEAKLDEAFIKVLTEACLNDNAVRSSFDSMFK